MSNKYGVTEEGFVIKRLDDIMDSVHSKLSEGFGFDTRLSQSSFLKTLITTFCGQIADLWEVGQDSYYAKYPSTASGLNLDNAVQYGGIRRKPDSRTIYPLYCTGDDGTTVRANTYVATDTLPEIRLYASGEFKITREAFNSVSVKVAVVQAGTYTVSINGDQYSYQNTGDDSETEILNGLKTAITDGEFTVAVEGNLLKITDTIDTRSNLLELSENLTTSEVTVIAPFLTEDYGRIELPNGIVTKMINNIAGFNSVTNMIEPTYGRLQETDIELRQSYLAKSAIRSNTMVDSIVAELLNNVAGVESASGYENDDEVTDDRGLPPHSIEIVVDGGSNADIAQAILQKKAGGIQTFGSITVNVDTEYGDSIPVKFNRPDYLYTWLKVTIHGSEADMPTNYKSLVIDSILADGEGMVAGDSLLIQTLMDGIYNTVAGVTYVDIITAYTTNEEDEKPQDGSFKAQNVMVTTRQRVLLAESRIEVTFDEDS